jgi:hypothetical protein
MSRDKVLLATTVYGDVCVPYLLGVADTLRLTDAEYVLSITRATYVQAGRQKLVGEARTLGCTEIIFADADMDFRAQHVARLRSHQNVDIVGAIYPKRQPGEPEWTVHTTGEPEEGDLVPVNDIGFGLLRAKISVFEKLDAFLPQRRYKHGAEPEKTEYFPVARTLKDSWQQPHEPVLNEIRRIVEYSRAGVVTDTLGAIDNALKRLETASVEITGEDVAFVRLCRAAGIRAFADKGCVLRHVGQISYPAKLIPL